MRSLLTRFKDAFYRMLGVSHVTELTMTEKSARAIGEVLSKINGGETFTIDFSSDKGEYQTLFFRIKKNV